MPLRALVTDRTWPDLAVEEAILGPAGIELVEPASGDEAGLIAAAAGCHAIMTQWAKVTPAVIDAAGEDLRIVCRLGIGLDNIDVAHATARRVIVTNVPDYCVDEVAEHAMALLLAMARNVALFHEQARRGVYDLASAPPMRRLAGRTLGVVGFGLTGQAVARRAVGLGLDVLVFNRSEKPTPPGVTQVGLDRLLAESDYVSIHVPLTPETRHLIGRRDLESMKPTAGLINTARGPIVDAAALEAVLAAGHLGGVALDVQDPEPPDLSRPLYRHARVIVTPHAAFVSEESLADLRRRTATQVRDRLTGGTPENIRNPEALTRKV